MRIKATRRAGESLTKFLKRFLTRFHRSGLALEYPKHLVKQKKLNERKKFERRMYRLKLQQFVEQRLKEGWDMKKAIDMARRYIQYIKYKG